MTDDLKIDARTLRNDPKERAERRKALDRTRAMTVHVDHFNADHGTRVKRAERRARKHTLQTVNALLEKYMDPREVLLQIANTPTEQLAQQLRCSMLEAHQERRHAALAILPYVASKMPVQVDMRHTRAVHIHFENADEERTIEPPSASQPAALIDLTADVIDIGDRGGEGSNIGRGAAIARDADEREQH